MGGGIAQLAADKGLPARMKDIEPKALAHGFAAAAAIWREAVREAPPDAARDGAQDGPALGHARLLGLRAVRGHDRGRRREARGQAGGPRGVGGGGARATAIFASNTSTLPITEIARRRARARARRRDALLQPGAPDAAGRGHPRRAHERRDGRDDLRAREDARARRRSSSGTRPGSSSTGSWRPTSPRRCAWCRRAAASRTSTRP